MARAISTSATEEVECPKCGAIAGEDCKTPKGRKMGGTHGARQKAYQQSLDPDEFKARHAIQLTRPF